jgi:hypothetical protein
MVVLLRDTPVTAIGAAVTVTAQVAVFFPSSVVAVITALPVALPVITPFVTDTVLAALLAQVTLWLVASAGITVALSVSIAPTYSVVLVLFSVTPVTATLVVLTVTAQESVFRPSAVVTVMTAFPAALPVTTPFITDATAGALLSHVTFWFVASLGVTVAVRVSIPFTRMTVLSLLRDTPVTATWVSIGFSPCASVVSASQPGSNTLKASAR